MVGFPAADPWEYIARAAAESADNEIAVDLAYFPARWEIAAGSL
ncbi:MAG TPA: hypothetical protein VMP01_22085 [Pirellulaceae bacterium]|nr:hypothetical protein [Pirellulaceae bacterium]